MTVRLDRVSAIRVLRQTTRALVRNDRRLVVGGVQRAERVARRGGPPMGSEPGARCLAPPIPINRDRELPSQARLVPGLGAQRGGPRSDRTRAASGAPPRLDPPELAPTEA